MNGLLQSFSPTSSARRTDLALCEVLMRLYCRADTSIVKEYMCIYLRIARSGYLVLSERRWLRRPGDMARESRPPSILFMFTRSKPPFEQYRFVRYGSSS